MYSTDDGVTVSEDEFAKLFASSPDNLKVWYAGEWSEARVVALPGAGKPIIAITSERQLAEGVTVCDTQHVTCDHLVPTERGDVKAAENYIGQAGNASGLAEALGNLHLAQGNYALAEQDFNGVNSNSAALAQILNKNYAKAAQTLKNVEHADGMTDYLQAIVNARQGNNDAAAAFVRSAVQKDPSLAAYAASDLEMKNVK